MIALDRTGASAGCYRADCRAAKVGAVASRMIGGQEVQGRLLST